MHVSRRTARCAAPTAVVPLVVVAILAVLVSLARTEAGGAADWPSFRGPHARGVAEGPAPVTWDVPANRNVRWKVPVAGLGHSSPIVMGDQVCVTTAISDDPNAKLRVGLYGDIESATDTTPHTWKVVCHDRDTGRLRWEQVAHRGVPKVKRHPKSTHASSTLASDGERIVAMFGSEGLYCYDLKGRLLWKKDLGVLDAGFFIAPEAQWGFASSPIVHDGLVVIQADVQGGGFLAAFDVATGQERWRTPRKDVPTWSTPTVHVVNGRPQVVVNGWKHIGGYDLLSGKEIWRMTGGGDIPIPTPVVAHDLVFITNAHGPAAPIFAVRTSAKADITLPDGRTSSEHIAWSQRREGAYMQTPLVYGDLLYVCRDNGVLSVYNAKTGERLYQQRLADGRTGFTASGVAADGKVYYTSEDGDVYVIEAGPTFRQLAKNPLGEVTLATPAIVDGTIYFRTRGHLIAVGGGN